MVISFALYSSQSACSELADLSVFNEHYPKAIYFRNVENSAANTSISYEKWAKRWSKLDGMVVKALDEEIPRRSEEAQKKFIQYKKDNPEKLMLLHFNGNARDPNFDLTAFYPEDWTYFVGTYSADVISENDSDITVRDASVFRTLDDIAIVPVDLKGNLDWKNAEQAKLTAVSGKNKLTVKRGLFNTKIKTYAKGRAYLAAHVSQPAIAPGSDQALWRYNFTNITPQGGMPIRLTHNLMEYLGSDKSLSNFDGVEFDVLADIRGLKHPSRKTPIDYNYDGKASKLDVDHQQKYSQGVHLFLSSLRSELGKDKLILADGNEANQQREFSVLNGIESETWPSHWDPQVEQWSSGINRHLFWKSRSYSPSLNYIKLGKVPNKQGAAQSPPENLRRLRMAGSLFTDTVIAPAYRPKGKGIDNWSELIGDEKNYTTWLGKPLTDIQYLKPEHDDIVEFDIESKEMNFNENADLFTFKKINDREINIALKFKLSNPGDITVTAEVSSSSMGKQKAKGRVSYITITPIGDGEQKNMTWSDAASFNSRFYFKNLKKGQNSLTLASDADLVQLTNLRIQYGVEIPYRIFENGVVIANPSRKQVKVSTSKFSSIQSTLKKRGLKAKNLTINAKDAVFLSFE
jgi:hypothetical protein